ncbi:S-adenosyl-L-methionine-dependent methyltransferase [Syncephalis pseudoplumigaleata]|uniref:S-adenosyl-L-methionine-dependent methyltransferase n=1 Tax=Syncephalis pseudoplumigaleata TaxID=1712513 RepID=A0A4P9YT19_9FUNG|nr:S-adenosyl-L-methionine-dependent methyltransferase [Syncephalis pseudoplumigaleata]|eukprot:RKP22848.1 S-adenosyl-L-methionine-dependent methyltransferase [Syncephalis pseudoplumigaleata]
MVAEEEKLDLLNRMHTTLRYVIGHHHLVPSTTQPASILDVGTGTGTWLMEVAMEWPDAQCVGVDMSPQFPTTVMPKNCRFHLLDILEEPGLPRLAQSFDFVHFRFLAMTVPAEAWQRLCDDLWAVTADGGMLQMTGFAFQLASVGPAGEQINRLLRLLAEHSGLDADVNERLVDLLAVAGFDEVNPITISLPCGDWGGHVGRLFLGDFLAQLHTLKPRLLELCLTDEGTFAHHRFE